MRASANVNVPLFFFCIPAKKHSCACSFVLKKASYSLWCTVQTGSVWGERSDQLILWSDGVDICLTLVLLILLCFTCTHCNASLLTSYMKVLRNSTNYLNVLLTWRRGESHTCDSECVKCWETKIIFSSLYNIILWLLWSNFAGYKFP